MTMKLKNFYAQHAYNYIQFMHTFAYTSITQVYTYIYIHHVVVLMIGFLLIQLCITSFIQLAIYLVNLIL